VNTEQQQQVLDFVEFITQKEIVEDRYLIRERRVKQWLNGAGVCPDDSPGLPDEAFSCNTYSED
jgi:hypothetical protein